MALRIVIFVALLLVPMIPTFWAISHISKGKFATPGQKYRWLALVVFLPPVGGFIYLFAGRKRRLGPDPALLAEQQQEDQP